MFLKTRHDGSLMEVLSLPALFDPFAKHLQARLHPGAELQEPARFLKSYSIFPPGETLPRMVPDPL